MARDINIGTGLITRVRGLIDRSITLSGSSQTLMLANPIRKKVILKNGDTVASVNLIGGTAVVGGAGTITLQSYEGLALSGKECPLGAITVIGTNLKYFSALEGQ